MIFPDDWGDLEARVLWLRERCNETRRDRVSVYDRRERYFLFGTGGNDPVRYNRIESHIDLVASFLYAPDHAFYNIAAGPNAADAVVAKVTALQDQLNDDFADAGLSDLFTDAIPWALVYGTMIVKQGWNDVAGEPFAELVPPHQFGVFREDKPLGAQEAFVHSYALEYYDAVQRLVRAGRKADVARIAVTGEASPSPFPDMLTRLIIAGSGGVNLAGNMLGSVNPDYTPLDTYQPKSSHPMVMFDELWAWDSACNDYRVFHIVDPDIIVGDSKRTVQAMLSVPKMKKLLAEKATRTRRRRRAGDGELVAVLDTDAPGDDDFAVSPCNLFLPGDHPFTTVQPYRKYNYFWGKAHIDALMGLQDWMNERFEQIADLLDKQAYPPRVGTGMGGVAEEKFEQFGAADSWILEQMPNARIEELHPELPQDLFAEVKEIGAFFLEASGLTEVIAGAGSEGVRSGSHARQATRTGSGRIKKAALALEPALTRIGDIGLRLKIKNDDRPIATAGDGDKPGPSFLAAQLPEEVRIRISGHSHSPLFADDARELAALLLKAEAIDKEMFARMMHPPQQDAILHGIRRRERDQARFLASLSPEERKELMMGHRKGAGHGSQAR